MRIIELRRVYYGHTDEYVLRNINLVITSGQTIVVKGRSGVGKTTLSKILALLYKPSLGNVYFLEKNVTDINEKEKARLRLQLIGYVDQEYRLIDGLTILENVALPLRLMGYKRDVAEEQALDLLRELDIVDIASRFPGEVSGGQRQRAVIARALIKKPILIVADEPFSNLDEINVQNVIRLFNEYMEMKNGGIVITTTDLMMNIPNTKSYLLDKGILKTI